MSDIITQIVHRDPVHIALAEIDRLAMQPANLPTLRAIKAAEIAHKNRPTIITRTQYYINTLTN